MIYDCFLFNEELDLLEIRLNILEPYVDHFILVEATETFSGIPKKLCYEENKERFAKWNNKIIHHKVDTYTDEEWAEAKANPATGGLDHWCREFIQRENLKKPLESYASPEDIIFICDVDEIWNPDLVPNYVPEPTRLKLDVYTYWLNNKSSEEFWGPFVATWEQIKNRRLNDIKNTCAKTYDSAGWHFTSMGGAEALKKKIESYGHQEFNTDFVKNGLEQAISTGKDFIGRDFSYTIDTNGLPSFLKETDKYNHLMKQND